MTPENEKLVADLSKEIPRDSLTANDLKRSNLIRAIDAIKTLSDDNEWLRKRHLEDEALIVVRTDETRALNRERAELRAELARLRAAPGEWIKLSERKPTREEADKYGRVLVWYAEGSVREWGVGNIGPTWTHWQRLPAPPAPEKTAAQLQAEEDEKAWQEYYHNVGNIYAVGEARNAFKAALAHARSQGKDGAK